MTDSTGGTNLRTVKIHFLLPAFPESTLSLTDGESCQNVLPWTSGDSGFPSKPGWKDEEGAG